MPSVPRKRWPAELQRSWALRGVFVGGCVARGDGSSFRAKAHAHTTGQYQGWICIRRPDRLEDRMLMLHELAHIITGEGHTDRWRACLERIGGTLDVTHDARGQVVLRSYRKQTRQTKGTQDADVLI